MTRAPSGAERIEGWLGPAGAAYGILVLAPIYPLGPTVAGGARQYV